VPLLRDVDLAMPSPPDLCGGEHPASSAHVTERSLSRSMSTTSRHTRDTRDGATSAPRLGGGVLACPDMNGDSLALVLVHVGVDRPDNIRPVKKSEVESGATSLHGAAASSPS